MTIQRAREILGDEVKDLTDEEMINFMKRSETMIDAMFDFL